MTTPDKVSEIRPAGGKKQGALALLVAAIGVCFSIAWLAAQWVPGPWYDALRKPDWTPPQWVFAPVWTGLYALMGIAAWLVWREGRKKDVSVPLGLFLIQLILNGAWSWLFFGLHNPEAAAIDIVLLTTVVLATLIAFWQARPLAGTLFLPYFAWVLYAASLNLAIAGMNP